MNGFDIRRRKRGGGPGFCRENLIVANTGIGVYDETLEKHVIKSVNIGGPDMHLIGGPSFNDGATAIEPNPEDNKPLGLALAGGRFVGNLDNDFITMNSVVIEDGTQGVYTLKFKGRLDGSSEPTVFSGLLNEYDINGIDNANRTINIFHDTGNPGDGMLRLTYTDGLTTSLSIPSIFDNTFTDSEIVIDIDNRMLTAYNHGAQVGQVALVSGKDLKTSVHAIYGYNIDRRIPGQIWDIEPNGRLIRVDEGSGEIVYDTNGVEAGVITDGTPNTLWDYGLDSSGSVDLVTNIMIGAGELFTKEEYVALNDNSKIFINQDTGMRTLIYIVAQTGTCLTRAVRRVGNNI